jgi:hypothetical protein
MPALLLERGLLPWLLLLLRRRLLLLSVHTLLNARQDLPGSRAVHPQDLLHTPLHHPATY